MALMSHDPDHHGGLCRRILISLYMPIFTLGAGVN